MIERGTHNSRVTGLNPVPPTTHIMNTIEKLIEEKKQLINCPFCNNTKVLKVDEWEATNRRRIAIIAEYNCITCTKTFWI